MRSREDDNADPRRETDGRSGVTRRKFIIGTGVAGAAWKGRSALARKGDDGPGAVRPPQPVERPWMPFFRNGPDHSIHLHRRDDILDLRIDLYNLVPDGTNPAQLVRGRGSGAALLVAVFGPQHVSEGVVELTKFGNGSLSSPPDYRFIPPPSTGAVLSGPSRLAFIVPDSLLPLPLTLDTLLDWDSYTPSLSPAADGLSHTVETVALSDGRPPFTYLRREIWRAPLETETAIELPWKLLLSPTPNPALRPFDGWMHWDSPVELQSSDDGITALFHSRLRHSPGSFNPNPVITARAIWARDFDDFGSADEPPVAHNFATGDVPGEVDTQSPDPIELALDRRDRWEIAHATTKMLPAHVDELALSPLGGWFDGLWASPDGQPLNGMSLTRWRHTTTAGRDQHVMVSRLGALLPFGHEAVYIKVAERDIATATEDGTRNAYLFSHDYILITEPVIAFDPPLTHWGDADDGHDHRLEGGRRFPFTTVVCEEVQSPVINTETLADRLDESEAFIPRVGGRPWRARFRAVDLGGRVHSFDMPVAWVSNPIAHLEVDVPAGADDDEEAELRSQRFVDLQHALAGANRADDSAFVAELGRRVTFAPEDSAGPGAASFPTEEIHFGVQIRPVGFGPVPRNEPPGFAPYVRSAAVSVPSLEAVTGQEVRTTVVYADLYRQRGLNPSNPAEIIFQLGTEETPGPVAVTFSGRGSRSGGVATPDFSASHLSRSKGAITAAEPPDGELHDFSRFNPADYLDPTAQLLAGTTLSDILAPDQLPSNAPVIRTVEHGDRIETVMRWSPTLKSPDPAVQSVVQLDTNPSLDLRVVSNVPKGGGPATTSIRGELRGVFLNLLPVGEPFARIHLDRIVFTEESGSKPDLDVQVSHIEFLGALKVMARLAELMPFGGDDGGLSVDVTPSGIGVGLGFDFPAVEIGVFTLKNLAFAAALSLPFNGDPVSAKFAFASSDRPASLTVSGLGGGGYFELEASTVSAGIELSLEFGGDVGLNLGVASGSVEIKAGIVFALVTDTNGVVEKVDIIGFVRVHGQVTVLGVASVSIQLRLELGYKVHKGDDKIYGRATMVVEVEVLLVSTSVSITIERTFSGNEDDPLFADAVDRSDWDLYAASFAPLPT